MARRTVSEREVFAVPPAHRGPVLARGQVNRFFPGVSFTAGLFPRFPVIGFLVAGQQVATVLVAGQQVATVLVAGQQVAAVLVAGQQVAAVLVAGIVADA